VISALLTNALAEEASAAKLENLLAREAEGVDGGDLRRLAELLEVYLNGVPSAVDALIAMTKEPPYGRSVAFVSGQVLLYLVDEDDLFRDAEFGALGLLDDAYLIHSCLAACRAFFPGLSSPDDYAAPDADTLAAVRALLPAGVPEALDRTCENLVRVASAMYSGGGPGVSAEDGPTWSLRVDDAVAALGPGA
jgi:hypothetical protein